MLPDDPAPSRNELRHLLVHLLTQRIRPARHLLHWSRWRHRHQACAQASHYRRRTTPPHNHELALER